MMWVIMFLILLVCVFNVMSSQIMLVIDKKKEIGILKTIGMRPSQIRNIFLIEGSLITSISAVLGGIFGNFLAIYLKQTLFVIEAIINFFRSVFFFLISAFVRIPPDLSPFRFFPKEIYYFQNIPTDISFSRTIFLILFAILLSIFAGLVPSNKAAKLRPMEVMRYE